MKRKTRNSNSNKKNKKNSNGKRKSKSKKYKLQNFPQKRNNKMLIKKCLFGAETEKQEIGFYRAQM